MLTKRVALTATPEPSIAFVTFIVLLCLISWPKNYYSGGLVSAEALSTSDAAVACDYIDFSDSQEKHYGKTDFAKHSRVAETVGNLLAVFYDETTHAWTITPEDLREIVLSNIHAVEGTWIYGSAIAFEPNVWRQTTDLSDGVPFPAASGACLNISQQYCESDSNNTDYRITTLANTSSGEKIYCPYAYHGSPEEEAFANCSKQHQEYCPTMDLARAYDYSDVTNPDVEWYTAPRCLFLLNGITTGYWTSPYFDAGAGNINMVTFSQPIVKGDKFLGIATIDIEVEDLCYGNQCDNACPAEEYNYTVTECDNDARHIAYSSTDPSCPIDPNAVSTLSCSFVPATSTIGIICLVLGSLGALICLCVMLYLIAKRKLALIKASQVSISCGFVAGAFLANIGTFALLGEPTSANCKLRFWAIILPLTMLLAFLFGKVYRTYKVFMAAQQFQRIKISDSQLLLKIGLVILVQVVILLVWTFVEDSTGKYVAMSQSVDHRYCIGDGCYPTEKRCKQNHNIVSIFSFIYLGIIVIAGCVLSYQARKLPDCLCEARYIMLAMYNIALIGILVGIVAAVAELSISAQTLLLTFATFVIATGSVLLVFLPKFIKIWSMSEEQIKRSLRESVRTSTIQARASTYEQSVEYGRSSVYEANPT